MAQALLSVVMPVHNAATFLDQSINSILNQTFTEFEFVVLDDASTDGSVKILNEWARRDDRLLVYTSAEKLGLSFSSNSVVAKSQASIIARMDADDLSAPERLGRQWQVLQDHLDVALVGTLCDGIDAAGRRIRPRDRSRILRRSLFPPFPHGSVMFRREVFDKAGGYQKRSEGFEDQDLFRRMMAHGRVVTLPEVLYHYRYHLQSASIKNHEVLLYRPELADANGLSRLHALGAMRLWAGQPPAIMRAVIDDRSAKSSMQKFTLGIWATWGDVHARSLRACSRLIVQTRDRLAARRVTDGRFYEWRLE